MTVITGGRAEELDLFLSAPGTGAVQQAVGKSTGDDISHHIQRGSAADEDVFGFAVQNVCPVSTGRGKTCQFAVVSGIDAAVKAVFGGLKNSQHIADQIQLSLCGLAAGHVQIQLLILAVFILCHYLGVFVFQFFFGHAGIGGHIHHPLFQFP